MWDNREGGELDPADDVRRHCKKNSSIFILHIVHRYGRQKKAVTVAAKSGQFTASKTGMGQLPPGIFLPLLGPSLPPSPWHLDLITYI